MDYSASEEQTALMAVQAEALGSLEQKLDPVLELALAKFPDLSEDEAIQALVKSVEELEEATAALVGEDVFRPVSAQVRQAAVVRLQALATDQKLVVKLSVQNGSRNRSLVAMELRKILDEANIKASQQSAMVFSSGVLPPFQIIYHQEDTELAHHLVRALFDGVVAGTVDGKKTGKVRGTIEVNIYGTPVFSPDGLYRFR